MRIYKYSLLEDFGDENKFTIPRGATIVKVGQDPNGVPSVWAIIDPDAPLEHKTLVVIGTGFDIPPGALYHGSYMEELFVWHVFETAQEVLPSKS